VFLEVLLIQVTANPLVLSPALVYNVSMKNSHIPKRSEVAKGDKWNIELLFKNNEEWEKALAAIAEKGKEILKYKDAFSKPETIDAQTLAACLRASTEADRLAESVGNYAFLNKSTDEGDPVNIDRSSRYLMTVTELSAATSWLMPAIMEIPEEKIRAWIDPASPTGKDFADFKVSLEKTLYLKPHTLSDKEEKILSLLSEPHGTASQSFSVLTNVDLDFGTVKTKEGEVKLSQSSYSSLMLNPDRDIREKAYKQFYGVYNAHKNTIASLYTGQVQQDIAQHIPISRHIGQADFDQVIVFAGYEVAFQNLRNPHDFAAEIFKNIARFGTQLQLDKDQQALPELVRVEAGMIAGNEIVALKAADAFGNRSGG